MINKKLQRGFTLVELLVVIAIIIILATLLLLQLDVARRKGRDTKRVGDVTQLRTAVELYYDENGFYPQKIDDATIGKYMGTTKAPLDPSTKAPYGYGVDANPAKKYQIWAQLEQINANAFNNDADITTIPSPGTDGSKEGTSGKCVGPADCVFDLGVN